MLWNGKFMKFLLVSLVYLLTIMAFGDDLEGVGGKLTSDEDFFLILFVNLMFKVVLLKTYQLPCEITNLGT
jgi:hypothetical protein